MARITVEDCIDKFSSRFELVLVASNRARKLFSGEKPTVEIDNDKNTVIALREIADETITKDQLKNDLIEEYQTNIFSEDEDINEIEDNIDESNTDESNTDESNTDESNTDESNTDESNTEENELNTNDAQQDNVNHDQQTQETNAETSQDNLDPSPDEEKF